MNNAREFDVRNVAGGGVDAIQVPDSFRAGQDRVNAAPCGASVQECSRMRIYLI